MPTSSLARSATPDELESLRKLLAAAPGSGTRFKRAAVNALVVWAALLLAVVAGWFALGWLLGKAFHWNPGLHGTATIWVVAVAAPLCAAFAIHSTIKWVRSWPNLRPKLQEDLTRATVIEERYVFVEAKRFQEQEHGGLIYLLRSVDDEVFASFDYESQTLGVDDGDPLLSDYRPQAELLLVRAPASGHVVARQWAGAELSVGPPLELTAGPAEWPADESLCPIPWEQLEQRLGSGPSSAH